MTKRRHPVDQWTLLPSPWLSDFWVKHCPVELRAPIREAIRLDAPVRRSWRVQWQGSALYARLRASPTVAGSVLVKVELWRKTESHQPSCASYMKKHAASGRSASAFKVVKELEDGTVLRLGHLHAWEVKGRTRSRFFLASFFGEVLDWEL